MRMKFLLITAIAGSATAFMSGTAGAMMPGQPSAMLAAVDGIAIAEDVQYGWQGRRYCFYDDGWHGAGWYRCGYRLRVGFGWGGPGRWDGAVRLGVGRPGRRARLASIREPRRPRVPRTRGRPRFPRGSRRP